MRNLIIVFISLFTFCIGISGQQKCKLNVGSFNLRYDNEGIRMIHGHTAKTWRYLWFISMILMSLGFKKG